LTGLHNRGCLETLLKKDLNKKNELKRAVISINLSTVQLLTANYGFQYTQNIIKNAAVELSRYCAEKRKLFQTYDNQFVFYVIDYHDKKELDDFCNTIAKNMEALFVSDRISGGIGVLEIIIKA
jgi:GGDEF domain-containing protein